MKKHLISIAALAFLAGCVADITEAQIATLEQAALLDSAKASDINPHDYWTSRTECDILGGQWTHDGGGSSSFKAGVKMSGCEFPGDGVSAPAGVYLAPVVSGRSGTAFR